MLVTQKSEPTSYLSSLKDFGNGILVAGSGDGSLHFYDYNNSWSHSYLSISSQQIAYIDNFNDNSYFAIDGNDEIFFIDESSNLVTNSFSSNLGTMHVLGELSGQISVIFNSGSVGKILFYDLDGDGDGVSDSLDDFPFDPTQQADSDDDGFGDNINGINGDLFPNNPEQYADSDGDGYGDNELGEQGDFFPDNPEQWSDLDGDGYGDNSDGLMGDQFIEDPSQWNDTDGDGYGDNPLGNTPDSCPEVPGFSKLDRFGCLDTDFDFYSNPDSTFTAQDLSLIHI